MGLFSKLFDFNKDGKVSVAEAAVAATVIKKVMEPEKKAEQIELEYKGEPIIEPEKPGIPQAEDDTLDFELDVDLAVSGVEAMRPAELHDKKDELEDMLFDLEMDEPDMADAEAHDRWEQKREYLEEHIQDIGDLIDEAGEEAQEDTSGSEHGWLDDDEDDDGDEDDEDDEDGEDDYDGDSWLLGDNNDEDDGDDSSW